MNRSGELIQQASDYKAFIPAALPPVPDININKDMQALLTQAEQALARLDGVSYTLPNQDLIIAMYVRKEALLSAQIEGIQASLDDIFAAQEGDKLLNADDVEEVINYIAAMNFGLNELNEFPMSLRLIKEIHKLLMEGVRGHNKTPGEFRKSQNWIGPAGATLKDASFVPPPPHDMQQAMNDLELYMHQKSELSTLIQCALIHYQFETIHPFLDGNGRLGRLLIMFYLCWKSLIQKPLLYISLYFKKYQQEYYDRLSLVRQNGDYDQWISFFLKGVIETSGSAIDTIKRILSLQADNREFLWKNNVSSPYAIGLLDFLFQTPHLSIKTVEQHLEISFQSASTLVNQFESLGILTEVTGKKRDKRFVFTEYVDILSEGTV